MPARRGRAPSRAALAVTALLVFSAMVVRVSGTSQPPFWYYKVGPAASETRVFRANLIVSFI